MLNVFLVAKGLFCCAALSMAPIRPVSEFVERFERYIVCVVFVFIGVMLILESGRIPWLI